MTESTARKTITLGHGAFALVLLGALVIGLVSGALAGGYVVAAARARAGSPDSAASRPPERAWLGMTYVLLTPAVAQRYNTTVQSGALVVAVTPGSPAEHGGLLEGDIITAMDQRSVGGNAGAGDAIMDAIRGKKSGDKLQVIILRNGSEQSLDIVLGRLPQWSAPSQTRSPLQRLYDYMMRRFGAQ
jgi:S1-C subfamily serine protease